MSIEREQPLTTMLLLGAGASKPAGIPTILELTTEYLSDPLMGQEVGKYDPTNGGKKIYETEDIHNAVEILVQITNDFFEGKMDLELLMSILLRLQNKNERELFNKKYTSLDKINDEVLKFIIELIQEFIRKKCENISSIMYLWTLNGLPHTPPLDIFTLNYDGTIEIFCEKNSVGYTDGFDPYWHPENFTKNLGINLYKLHGSLYWFRTESGKTIKVPMKGLHVSDMKYLTDEKVSEMMIYPTLIKDKESMVYSWISQKFKEQLNRFEVCIIIGYSFRDDYIKTSLIESLSSNGKLWLIVVNPHASDYKKQHFSYDNEISARVITMDMGIEAALAERKLHSLLQILQSTRVNEEQTWHFQKSSENRLDDIWTHVLSNYLRINHHDKVKEIVELLSGKKIFNGTGNFPGCVEGVVLPFAFYYMIGYHKNDDRDKFMIWKNIFYEASITLEHKFFVNSNVPKLIDFNPVKKDELPRYCMDGGTEVRTKIFEFKRELINSISLTTDNLKPKIEKLIETLDFLYTKGPHSIMNRKPLEIIEGYQQNNLGIKKWTKEIIDSL